MDLGADPVAHGPNRGSLPPPSNAAVHAAATSGSSATTSARWRRLSTRVGIRLVDVGEVRDLSHQVQIDLGDQMVFRGEVGVGGRRGDLGAGGDCANGQVGVGRLAQDVDACGLGPYGRSLPPTVAWHVTRRTAGVRSDRDRWHRWTLVQAIRDDRR